MLQITQEQYENIVFLTRCVYYDLPYPTMLGYQQSASLLTGLRINVFDTPSHTFVVICGTNQVRDWITNLKAGLGIIPRQYQQALSFILNIYKDMDKEKPLIIAGHSLGAMIANYCASFMSDTDVICIGFNGAPVGHLCGNKNSNNIVNIIAKNDLLNCVCKLFPVNTYMKHIGQVHIVNDNYKINKIKAHCDLNTFMKFSIYDIYE